MAVDFEEAFARGCWWLPRRATFYLSAVWVGCMIGATSLVAGFLVAGAKPDIAPEPWFDCYADSFVTLADALGA